MKIPPYRIAQIEERFAELEPVAKAASLRLGVTPIFRHPREGGGPSPERWVCKMGEGMDSRLRGNDEVHVVGVAP